MVDIKFKVFENKRNKQLLAILSKKQLKNLLHKKVPKHIIMKDVDFEFEGED